MNTPPGRRRRNPRGEGARLKQEIIAAAIRLIDAQGSEAVTLRAVAREVGISAPSIYPHFENRDEILAEVIQHCFAQLSAEIAAERDLHEDPVERLEAGCRAYLGVADRCPRRYALLFREPGTEPVTQAGPPRDGGALTFGLLVTGIADCAAAGRATSTHPFADAVALWAALHGYAGLRSSHPGFPWPPSESTLRRIIHGLAHIKDADPAVSTRRD